MLDLWYDRSAEVGENIKYKRRTYQNDKKGTTTFFFEEI